MSRPSGSAAKRLTGSGWYKRRKRIFDEKPLCELCRVEGIVTAASVLDHCIPLAQLDHDDERSVWPLCKGCHDKKTLHERGCHAIGEDGWPTSTLTPRQVAALEQRIAEYEATRGRIGIRE